MKTIMCFILTVFASFALQYQMYASSILLDGEIIELTPILCHGDETGVLRAESDGNASTTFYIWSNGPDTQEISNLPAGVYTVTITDVTGGSIVLTHELEEPQPITIDLTAFDVTCFGSSDGFIQAIVAGGTGMFQFNWSNGSQAFEIHDLSGGVYELQVIDENNCLADAIATVAEPEPIFLEDYIIDITDEEPGVILVVPTGGVDPYTALWDGPEGFTSTEFDIEVFVPGFYTILVTDASGCQAERQYFIDQILGVEDHRNSILLNGFPNPVYDFFSLVLPETISYGSIECYSIDGRLVLTESVTNSNFISISTSGLLPGHYILQLTDNQRVFNSRFVKAANH